MKMGVSVNNRFGLMGLLGSLKKIPLWGRIIIGLLIGTVVGLTAPDLATSLAPLGTAFMKAIKMIVIPLIFSTVTLGIYKMGTNMKELGKLSLIAFIWFYVATGIAMIIGIALNEVFHPAAGLVLESNAAVSKDIAKTMDWSKFLLDIIPDNIVSAMADQKIIPTLFFAICFGMSIARTGESGKRIADLLESVMEAMFKLTQGILATAPICVASIIAWVVASQGLKLLLAMGKLLAVLYLGLVILALIFCCILYFIGINPFKTIKKIAEPLLLGFTTNSSEVTLPVHMKVLEESGMPSKVVSLVVPLGYSFNLDGAALYQALATCFIAEAYGLDLNFSTLLTILITALIANKGTANVPGASLVVLSVLLTSLGLPVEGIAIIAGIDYIAGMGRTTINVFGNTVAAHALCKWGQNHQASVEKIVENLDVRVDTKVDNSRE
jgi:DAACS family dicarboxylate/amino acid:cation (Na+ or H+) symporter